MLSHQNAKLIKKYIAYLPAFIQSTSLKRRLIIAFYALNSSVKSLACMNLLMLASLIFHYTITYINGIEKRAENMCELCDAGFCILSIIAGESSFSTGDNRDSTVDASVIAPVSALDLDHRREIYGASGTSIHFPRMSEINCARVCRR